MRSIANKLPALNPINNVPFSTVTHLHGSASLPQYDGYANDKTYPGQVKTYKYPNWQHRIPGQGEMDYVRVFAALAEAKFSGSAAVECFTDMKFEEACDRGYEAMSSAMRKAGI